MLTAIAGRIGMVVLGYFAALAAGSAAFPGLLALISLLRPDSKLWEWLGLGPVAFLVAPMVFVFVLTMNFALTYVPAAIAHLVTEYFSLRALWLHIAIAAALSLGAGLRLLPDWFAGMNVDRWLITLAALLAAAVAGLVYWAIAGRNAGLPAKPAA